MAIDSASWEMNYYARLDEDGSILHERTGRNGIWVLQYVFVKCAVPHEVR